jgi:hypothetical protein
VLVEKVVEKVNEKLLHQRIFILWKIMLLSNCWWWFIYSKKLYFWTLTEEENEFSPSHEENNRILTIDLWGERKEKEEKGELKGRDWRNW